MVRVCEEEDGELGFPMKKMINSEVPRFPRSLFNEMIIIKIIIIVFFSYFLTFAAKIR